MRHPAGHPPGGELLDERDRRILAWIVREHIAGGEPVGSHAIARHADCSSATVRAVMADLEALGYLEKPHTSAGRVPTARGYRYYVDALLHVKRGPAAADKELIERRTQDAASQVDELLAEASRLLHSLTHHAAVVAAPRPQAERLQRIEFLKLREGRILAVLVARSGRVQNRLLDVSPSEAPTQAELQQGANYLNSILGDLTLAEARSRLRAAMEDDRAALDALKARALLLGARAVQIEAGQSASLHVEGQASFLEEPALLHDLAKMRALFRALAEKERLLGVLDRAIAARELKIFIGTESGFSEPELAIVAAPYQRGGELVGALGVIGPTRMDYSRVIPLVEFTARTVGLALGVRHE